MPAYTLSDLFIVGLSLLFQKTLKYSSICMPDVCLFICVNESLCYCALFGGVRDAKGKDSFTAANFHDGLVDVSPNQSAVSSNCVAFLHVRFFSAYGACY